jgi:hypothetical protein
VSLHLLYLSQARKSSSNSRLGVEVSLFVLSPEIEDRDEIKVATGRSTKRPSALNGTRIYYFIFQVLRYSNWIERSF